MFKIGYCIVIFLRVFLSLMKKAILFLLILPFFLSFFASKSLAADKMVFDSTNNYLGACQLTDKSQWTLTEDLNVTVFEVWYNWNQGETELPVTITKDGVGFASFVATRTSCDPYQGQWCNADFAINKLFPKGTYSTKIPNARQCLKPGGTGAVRIYIADTGVSPSITPLVTNITSPTPTLTLTPTPVLPLVTQCAKCNCNSWATIGVTMVFSSVVFFLVRKKLPF